jgi:hypothetical protein
MSVGTLMFSFSFTAKACNACADVIFKSLPVSEHVARKHCPHYKEGILAT